MENYSTGLTEPQLNSAGRNRARTAKDKPDIQPDRVVGVREAVGTTMAPAEELVASRRLAEDVDYPREKVETSGLVLRERTAPALSPIKSSIQDESGPDRDKFGENQSLKNFSPGELKELGDLVSARVEAEWPKLKEVLAKAVVGEKYEEALEILADKVIFFSLEKTLKKHLGGSRAKIAGEWLDRMSNMTDYFAGQALKDIVVVVHNKGIQQPISWTEQLKVWYPYFGDQAKGRQKLRKLRLEKGTKALRPQELADLINNKLMAGTQESGGERGQEMKQAQAA